MPTACCRADRIRARFGAALTHPYITTDYSEALPELVTPPQRTQWETLQFLCDLHAFIERRLDGELLWPASMPCDLPPDDEIPIADYGPSNLGRMKTVYRRGLGHRYGRAMQAIAGVHFNYSLPANVLARVSGAFRAARGRCRSFARPSSWGSCATTVAAAGS